MYENLLNGASLKENVKFHYMYRMSKGIRSVFQNPRQFVSLLYDCIFQKK